MARTIGRYEVVRELGRGGMGAVYEVRDPGLPGRALALKVILRQHADADALARFQREAQALARVSHPGVVQVHAFDAGGAEPYLVTDLVPGEDLERHVERRRPAPAAAATLVRDLAGALAAVHAAGVVHRDLKPKNVLVRPDGSPVVIDFGVARPLEASRLTASGAVVGTVEFMPPEQADGRPVDARSDVYALGAILYWLLAGRPPFAGGHVQVLYAVLHKEPAWPAELDVRVPRGLDAVCRRAMAKDPAARHPTAAALAADLERSLAGEEEAGRPRRPAAAALVVGAGVLALVALAAWQRSGPPAAAVERPAPVGSATARAPAPPTPEPPRTTAPAPAGRERPREPWQVGPATSGGVVARFVGPDRLVALPAGSTQVELFHLGAGGARSLVRTYELPGPAWHLAAAATGEVVAGGGGDLWEWDVDEAGSSPRPLWRLAESACEGVALHPDARTLLFWSTKEYPRVIDLGAPRPIAAAVDLPGGWGGHVRGVVVAASWAFDLRGDGFLVCRPLVPPGSRGHGHPLPFRVNCLALDAAGRTLAVCGEDGRVELHAVERLVASPVEPVERPAPLGVGRIAPPDPFDAASNTAIFVCAVTQDRLWAATHRTLWSWRLAELRGRADEPLPGTAAQDLTAFGRPRSLEASPDGSLLLLGSTSTGQVLLRDADLGR